MKKKAQVNFVGEFYKLQKKAITHITQLVRKHENVIFYAKPTDKNEEDLLFDSPRLTYINKHNRYIGYGIIELTLAPNRKVSIKAKNLEEENDIQVFTLADMMGEEVIFLAAAIENVFKR
jgi:hypothetical protein